MIGTREKQMQINSTLNIRHSKLIIPDGTMKKLTDVRKLHSLGWKYKVELKDGIEKMYNWYKGSN